MQEIICCQDCGWKGDEDECNYKFEEIKPLCPKCDSTNLLKLNEDKVLV